jgi:hypothetical protein
MQDFSAGVMQVWDALAAVMVVNPLLAALWLLTAMVLAALLVYGWRRLIGS